MKVFLSWSGTLSNRITSDLRDFLKTVIQALDPFYSKHDISKGKRWAPELAKQLNDTNVGIVVLTSENTRAPWILFEAGALAKNMNSGFVCTLLVDIKDTDIAGPLADFQNTKFNKDDFRKLVHDINGLIEKPLDKHILDSAFDKHWGDFELKVRTYINEEKSQSTVKEVRSEKEILDEVLRIVRKFEYRHVYEEMGFLDRVTSTHLVMFNEKENQIEFWDEEREIVYDIPLQQLTDTGEILDFIFQVYRKGWCKPGHIYQFLECLEELTDLYFHTNAQGVFCPGGTIVDIDWDNKTKKIRINN